MSNTIEVKKREVMIFIISVAPLVLPIIFLFLLGYNHVATFEALVLTGILVSIALWEFLISRWGLAIKVRPVPCKELGQEEFAFWVENKTGGAISAGNKFCVLPRGFRMYDECDRDITSKVTSSGIYYINPVRNYLLKGGKLPNRNPELPRGALYCQEPASTDPTTGRGPWATYLDPHGSDSKKK